MLLGSHQLENWKAFIDDDNDMRFQIEYFLKTASNEIKDINRIV